MRNSDSPVRILCLAVAACTVLSCGSSSSDSKPQLELTSGLDVGSGDDARGSGDALDLRGDAWWRHYDIGEAQAECMQEPFGFGCPCGTNGQCAGGFCILGDSGYLCTQPCVEECPDPKYECKGTSGFGPDVVFLCVPKVLPLCQVCDFDYQCVDGVCTAIGGGNYCTVPCGDAKECPAGYVCPADVADPLCLPASGTCDCILKTHGQVRPCEVSGLYGTCKGVEMCDAASGWTECSAGTPAKETCDGLDNDCDGKVDDGLNVPECAQEIPGIGTCSGSSYCLGAEGWKCDAPKPAVEVCDFQDNDCDGEVDEEFKQDGKYATVSHCGTCNHDCTGTLPHATAACDGSKPVPMCVVGECDDGYFQINEYQCLPEGQVLCKPCSGDVECGGGACVPAFGASFCSQSCELTPCPETFDCQKVEGEDGVWCLPVSGTCDCFAALAGSKRPCTATGDEGICTGLQTCDPLVGWSACSAAAPTDEVCDGLDNDCNGVPDDGLGDGEACAKSTPGVGSCDGFSFCAGPLGWVCSAALPAPEACDYQDNDCDGEVDEGFVVEGKYTTMAHCGACNKSCEGAFPNATAYCDTAAPVPACRVLECDSGYYKLNDFQCILPQDTACSPCLSDDECFFARCVTTAEGAFCLNPCDEGACAAGYSCKPTPADGDICMPGTGSCACTEESKGAQKGCSVINEFGACFGYETCDPAVGWSGCTAGVPSAEVCDGMDNDCDGPADEGLPTDEACLSDNPFGTCVGTSVCLGAQGWKCTAQIPSEEVCNYADDDCDGSVDEGFLSAGKYASLDNCGACGINCTGMIPNATAKCDPAYDVPKCVVDTCNPGYVAISPFQCLQPPDTDCQPCKSKADCLGSECVSIDGQQRCATPCTDDGDCGGDHACMPYPGLAKLCQPLSGSCECTAATAGGKQWCSVSNQLGTCVGFRVCDPAAGWSACYASEPAAEECDGVDSDCDGLVDEDLPPSKPCDNTTEFGSCPGESVCVGKMGWQCLAQVPTAEKCNYLDDDCDGLTDEDFKEGDKYTKPEHCGVCNNACAGSIPNATEKCDASYQQPKCVVDVCDPGYVAASPLQCVVPPDTTCQPCKSSADCLGGTCVTLDGALRCAISCPDDSGCADGHACLPYPGEGSLCQPLSGSCECTAASAGGKRWCSSTNDLGSCVGFQTCDPVDGWSQCSAPEPAAEQCNGLDDDCDSVVDDGLPESLDCEKVNPWGTCKGKSVCLGPLGWVCQAVEAQAEACDYKDNDCDGLVDEDFKDPAGKYASFDHCGACGATCKFGFPNATAMCDASLPLPECVVETCNPGFYKLNAYQCAANTSTLCEPCVLDENCVLKSARCVQLPEGKFCGKSCATDADCPSGYSCKTYDGSLQCIPLTNSCECDGKNTQLSKKCSATWPTSPGEGEPFIVCYGIQSCTPQGWSSCQLPEDVCDAADNDCNGVVDDAFLVNGKYVDDTNCGQCGNNCTFLPFPHATGVCDPLKAVPDCVMKCLSGWVDVNDNPADGCECAPQPGQDTPDGVDQNCDGVDGDVSAALFVAKNGSDANPGTLEAPLLTLPAAISRSVATGLKDVYVATGVYGGSISLAAGVRIYGGYTSDFLKHDPVLAETVIMGGAFAPEKPGAVNAIGIAGAPGSTVLSGFTVLGKNNNAPGGSSYAIYVRNCTNALVLSDNRVVSGAGGSGGAGESGKNGAAGVQGAPGGNAYGVNTGTCNAVVPALPRAGGAGAAGVCSGGTATTGGNGGGNTCPMPYNAAPSSAENGTAGAGPSGGAGGTGGYDREVWYCSTFPGGECHQATGGNEVGNAGKNGAGGANGDTAGGNGCTAIAGQGKVVAGLWQGGSGQTGTSGANASGGGGGGAGGGAQAGSGCSARTQVGGAGGGGGSGGCGATGGLAGTPGGGSFGLFLAWDAPPASTPAVTDNLFEGGVGGTGGSGGNGGSGGPGGGGGQGGAEDYANAKCAAPGGAGGNGGLGGHGEGGGGGCGGASYCIFASGQGGASLATLKTNNTFAVGAGGAGGAGGASMGNPGDPGQAGSASTANF
jgi:hypothetical protein